MDLALASDEPGAREETLLPAIRKVYVIGTSGGVLIANPLDCTKIEQTCRMALEHGLDYIWIDTCCIDKSSSAELSEAINSMYRYYENANICFVHMADVSQSGSNDVGDQFSKSRWFARGWTLQELLAPRKILFLNQNWHALANGCLQKRMPVYSQASDMGTAQDKGFLEMLGRSSLINLTVLFGKVLITTASVAIGMSWASRRKTTRAEDEACSLLGIFGINMPMLYGEREKAFLRLQEDILRISFETTILAWDGPGTRLLASSPSRSARSGSMFPRSGQWDYKEPHQMTSRGLPIDLVLARLGEFESSSLYAILDCLDTRRPIYFIGLRVNVSEYRHWARRPMASAKELYTTIDRNVRGNQRANSS